MLYKNTYVKFIFIFYDAGLILNGSDHYVKFIFIFNDAGLILNGSDHYVKFIFIFNDAGLILNGSDHLLEKFCSYSTIFYSNCKSILRIHEQSKFNFFLFSKIIISYFIFRIFSSISVSV